MINRKAEQYIAILSQYSIISMEFQEIFAIMIDHIAFFKQHLVFRFSEFKAHVRRHDPKASDKNCHMVLYYHCKNNTLMRIRKGLYAVNDEYNPKDVSPFIVAAKATEDAVVAYHTAMESHGIAYTSFNSHVFLTKQSTFTFDFQGQHYRAVSNPVAEDSLLYDLGVEGITVDGVEIRRTNLARTIVDVLDRSNLSGGWEEVWRSLDSIVSFDANFSVKYALALGKASVIAKLGYFFDQRPEHLLIDAAVVGKLLPYIPKQPYYIDRKLPKERRVFIKKWSLVIPSYLHNREWEEPEHGADI